jgi:hypothetical protein
LLELKKKKHVLEVSKISFGGLTMADFIFLDSGWV